MGAFVLESDPTARSHRMRNRFPTKQKVRRPGIEPGPPAWKAGILATELSTLAYEKPSTGFEPVTSRLLSECSAN